MVYGCESLGAEGAAYSDFYNRRADWGPTGNDVRHRFALSSVYELPFGTGRKFLANSPVRYVVGGWVALNPIDSDHNYYDPRRSVRTETHKLIVNFSAAPALMDPSQSWRPRADTVVPPNPARAWHTPMELYDLRSDPWERKDLARDQAQAGVLKDLRSRLREHMEATRDPILEGAVTSPMHRKAVDWLRTD